MAEIKYKASLDTSNFDSGMGKMTKEVSAMDGLMGKIAGGLSIATLGSKALGAVIDFGKGAIDSLANYEKFSASLNTMMKGDKYGVASLQQDLTNLAKTTPFSLEDVQTGTKNLMAYGFQAGEITKNLTMIGNVSSGVGAPLNDIIYLYGTLRSSGRVTLMDLRQFAGRGIPIYEQLAKVMHKNTSEIGKMATAGKIGFSDIENAFKSMTGEGGQFFNLMEDQSKTVGGKISNMGDSWDQLKLHIGQSQRGIIASTIDFTNSLISEIDTLISHSNKLDDVFKKFNLKGYGSEWQAFNPLVFLGLMENTSETGAEKGMYSELESRTTQYKKNLEKSNISGMTSEQYKNLLGSVELGSQNELESIKRRFFQNKDQFKSGDLSRFTAYEIEEKKSLLSWIKQQRDLGKDTPKPPKDGEGKEEYPTEMRGSRPQAINININEVNGIKTATINSSYESIEKSKEHLSAALLEVVSDIYKITNHQ